MGHDGKAGIPLKIDLLGQEMARLSAYPKTVIAEKLEAMVSIGEANSRMKDFYDIRKVEVSVRQ